MRVITLSSGEVDIVKVMSDLNAEVGADNIWLEEWSS